MNSERKWEDLRSDARCTAETRVTEVSARAAAVVTEHRVLAEGVRSTGRSPQLLCFGLAACEYRTAGPGVRAELNDS